ncbi:MAG: DUF2065 family protein [Betaproteobacteria bacterium AqS2]|uniref:DUF2065 family protein n=1 Tax=Candidatus Amphirhobacter heronislandensis TaxID=1732024 RepID=A0A930XXS0_9GAMM|nr:DUF2065 family protein [Betaproteobacteria bacterium AqS2]
MAVFGILLYLLCEGLALMAIPEQVRAFTIAIFKGRKRSVLVTLAFVGAGLLLFRRAAKVDEAVLELVLPAVGFPLIVYGLLRLIVPRAFDEILLRFAEYSRGQLRSIGLVEASFALLLMLVVWGLTRLLA